MNKFENIRRKQLGEFLKNKRKKLNPTDFGFFTNNRKTSGLRREEVSMLLDISIDWYTWLEQGRDIHVSSKILNKITDIFQLNSHEQKYLFLLAQQSIPFTMNDNTNKIPTILQDFLNNQSTNPSYVVNPKWDIIGWNQSACAVFGDYNKMNILQRNSIWRAFNSIYLRNLLDDWETHAKKRVAQFRTSYSTLYKDFWWKEMLQRLINNKDFKKWWDIYDIEESPSGTKLLHHAIIGNLYLNHISFRWCDNSSLLVVVHMPADKKSKLKLEKLLTMDSI